MSPSTAAHADRKSHSYLARLERWVEADEEEMSKEATLAGLVLLAQMMYGADWVDGHAVLRKWIEMMKGKECFVRSEELKAVEKGAR